jgi:hypothetical protein
MSDELKIVLEDVKEKFDTVIEAFNMVKEKLDRHEQAEEERFQKVEGTLDRHEGFLQRIESRLIELGHDLNEHRNNTELHGQRKSFLRPPTERAIPPFAHCNPKIPPVGP